MNFTLYLNDSRCTYCQVIIGNFIVVKDYTKETFQYIGKERLPLEGPFWQEQKSLC